MVGDVAARNFRKTFIQASQRPKRASVARSEPFVCRRRLGMFSEMFFEIRPRISKKAASRARSAGVGRGRRVKSRLSRARTADACVVWHPKCPDMVFFEMPKTNGFWSCFLNDNLLLLSPVILYYLYVRDLFFSIIYTIIYTYRSVDNRFFSGVEEGDNFEENTTKICSFRHFKKHHIRTPGGPDSSFRRIEKRQPPRLAQFRETFGAKFRETVRAEAVWLKPPKIRGQKGLRSQKSTRSFEAIPGETTYANPEISEISRVARFRETFGSCVQRAV